MKTPIKRLTYTFHGICAHHPEKMLLFAIRRIDMAKANGPNCKTKRWWIYTHNHALCLDWD